MGAGGGGDGGEESGGGRGILMSEGWSRACYHRWNAAGWELRDSLSRSIQ